MEFQFTPEELNASFVEKCIFNYRKKNYGEFPKSILLSTNNTRILIDQNIHGIGFRINEPYTIFGIKIRRCLDIEENTLELF